MLSRETETLIAKLLVNLFEGEKSVEIARRNLADSKDFDAYQIFQRLDRERKNFVDEYNLAEFLRLNKIYVTPPEARLIVSFYDSDYDGNLNYTEFLNMVLSESNLNIRRISREKIGYKTGFPLTYDMEYSLSKVLERELELGRAIEIIVAELKNRNDFNLLDVYSLIQGAGKYISEASVRRFLIRSGIDFNEDELCAAFKRLDIDRDSRVTFTEFKRLFTAATGGSFTSNPNPSSINNILKSSNPRDPGLNTYTDKFDFANTAGKHTFNSLLRKNPLKVSLHSASKTRKTDPLTSSVTNNFNNNYNNNSRDKSPLKAKTESILNKSIERFCRSPYGKYSELSKSVGRGDIYSRNELEQNNELNNNRYDNNQILVNAEEKNENENNINNKNNEMKNNNLLYSTNFISTANSNTNNFGSTANTYAFSNANKLSSASNFAGSPNRAEFYPILSFEEETFNSYLKELLELENEIESAKFDLIIKADFNIEDAFRIFELSGRGYLTELDIKYGMNSLDIYPSKEELALLVKRYDMSNEGILNYNDFYEMLSPVDRDYRIMLENRVAREPVTRRFKSDIFLTTTRISFQDLLRVLINVDCRIESLRQRINKLPRFDIREFYEKFDKLSKGYILDIDIINYLRKYDIQYASKDIDYLFLRFDFNRDSRIQFNEFYNELNPKSREDFI